MPANGSQIYALPTEPRDCLKKGSSTSHSSSFHVYISWIIARGTGPAGTNLSLSTSIQAIIVVMMWNMFRPICNTYLWFILSGNIISRVEYNYIGMINITTSSSLFLAYSVSLSSSFVLSIKYNMATVP